MTRKTRNITIAAALLVPLAAVVGLRALNANLTGQAIGDDDGIVGVELSAVNHDWQSTGLSGAALSAPMFAQQVTANGGDPGVVRMKPDGQLRVQEYTGDDLHMSEAIDVLVLQGDLIANNVKGETGTVSVNQSNRGVRHTIELTERYTDPVVLLQMGTYNGNQPAHAQVFSTGRTSFTFGLIEPSTYGNGAHATETVHYAVIEAGRYTLPDGRLLVADTLAMTTIRHDPGEGYVSVNTKNWFDGPVINVVRPQGVDETVYSGGVEGALVGAWAIEQVNNQGMQKSLDVRFKREDTWSASHDLQDAIGTMGYVMVGEPGAVGSLELGAGNDSVSIDFEGEANGRCHNLTDLGLDDRIDDVDLTGQIFGRTSLVLYSGKHCTGGTATLSADDGARIRHQQNMDGNLWAEHADGSRAADNGDFKSARVLRTTSAKLVGAMCFTAGEVVLANEFGHLVFQEDGDLVQYRTNQTDDTISAVWSSQTAGQAVGGTFCTSDEYNMDLIIKDAAGQTVWTQETAHLQGAYQTLELTADCNLRITNDVSLPAAPWHTDTAGCWKYMPPAIMNAMPDYNMAFTDLDDDGENELVLVAVHANGQAFLTFDPFGIAHHLHTLGIDVDQAYWDALSPTQQALLDDQTAGQRTGENSGASALESVQTMLSGRAVVGAYAAVEMHLAQDSTQSNGWRAQVTVGGVEYESEPGPYGDNFVMRTYAVEIEASALDGNITATVTVGEVRSEQYVDKDGVAYANEANLVSAGVVLGDSEGSHIGFSASVGSGGGAAASWGRDDQYGFTLPIGKFGIAIYISGEDAKTVAREITNLAVDGYAEGSEASVYAWSWTANKAKTFGAGTQVWFTSAADDTRVFIHRKTDEVEGNLFTAQDATTDFFVVSGTASWELAVNSAVSSALDEVTNGATAVGSAFSAALSEVSNTVDVIAGGTAEAYAAVSSGAVNTAKSLIKKFKKFF